MLEIDLNLMNKCGKQYWFVHQWRKFVRTQLEYLSESKNFISYIERPIYENVWGKQYLLLNNIGIHQDEIIFYLANENGDESWPSLLSYNEVYIADTEEEADKLIEELNKQKEDTNE